MIDTNHPIHIFISFLSLWMVISFLISILGGWWSLSQYYLSKPHNLKKKWNFQSAVMRFMTGYGNCLNISVTDRGLLLSVLFLFRVGHPPLLIPLDDIIIEKYRSWFMKGVKLNFRKAPNIPLHIGEKLAREINEEIEGRWNEIFV